MDSEHAGPGPTRDELQELDSYAKASALFSQISGFQTWVMASATLYLTLTVGVWAAVVSAKIGRVPKGVLCGAHLIACVWLAAVFWGAFRSIRARFRMVDTLGERYFPTILEIGGESFRTRQSVSVRKLLRRMPRRWASSGKDSEIHRFFYVLPIAGAAGTIYLLIHRVF
jgi:hypothetical protein